MNSPSLKVFKTKRKYDTIHGEISHREPTYMKLFTWPQKKVWEELLGLYFRRDFKLVIDTSFGDGSIYRSAYGITFSKLCNIAYDINKPNRNSILILNNLKDYKKFKKKYGAKNKKRLV